MERGRSQVDRRLWFGELYDGRGYVELTTYRLPRHFAARLFMGGEDREIGIHLAAWFCVTLSVCLPVFGWQGRLKGWMPSETRETGFRLFWEPDVVHGLWDAMLTLYLWRDDMGTWYSDRRRQYQEWPWRADGWVWHSHPWRWVVGDTTYEQRDQREEPVTVEMPEGDYPAVFKSYRARWRRPRWFASPWLWRHEIEVVGGLVPFAGKGENSWDCDDDGVSGTTFAVSDTPWTAHEAARRFALDALKTRIARGGMRWAPRDGWPSNCRRAA